MVQATSKGMLGRSRSGVCRGIPVWTVQIEEHTLETIRRSDVSSTSAGIKT